MFEIKYPRMKLRFLQRAVELRLLNVDWVRPCPGAVPPRTCSAVGSVRSKHSVLFMYCGKRGSKLMYPRIIECIRVCDEATTYHSGPRRCRSPSGNTWGLKRGYRKYVQGKKGGGLFNGRFACPSDESWNPTHSREADEPRSRLWCEKSVPWPH